MMQWRKNGSYNLNRAMALAAQCLRVSPRALAAASESDPLHLNLPPLISSARESGLAPEALRIMAALYLQAELEQAGIIVVADLLARSRADLAPLTGEAARKLEEFATKTRDWYDREHRDLIFARLFGMGRAATSDQGNSINRTFQQVFAGFCGAITNQRETYNVWLQPDPLREAALRQTATALILNLSSRQFGNTLIAARQIEDQLQHAINLLNEPGIGARFHSRGLWDTLRKILGDQAPDLGRIVTRGQSGLRLLTEQW